MCVSCECELGKQEGGEAKLCESCAAFVLGSLDDCSSSRSTLASRDFPVACGFDCVSIFYSSLLMPLTCKDVLELLDPANSSSVNHTSLSDYAFLYGVFPTAPSVAIYAAQYNMQLEVVSFIPTRRYGGKHKLYA